MSGGTVEATPHGCKGLCPAGTESGSSRFGRRVPSAARRLGSRLPPSGLADGEPRVALVFVLPDSTVLGGGGFLSAKSQGPVFVPGVPKLRGVVPDGGSLFTVPGTQEPTGNPSLFTWDLFFVGTVFDFLLFPPNLPPAPQRGAGGPPVWSPFLTSPFCSPPGRLLGCLGRPSL